MITSLVLASAASFYCSGYLMEGASLKVDLTNNLICVNGGTLRADFCTDQYAKAYPIVRQAPGEVILDGQTYAYQEFAAQSAFVTTEVELVRIYAPVSSTLPVGPHLALKFHAADLFGKLYASML